MFFFKFLKEKRVLYYWFRENSDHEQKISGARYFFMDLINPEDFPGDYIHFIKKAMKLLEQSDKYYAVLRVCFIINYIFYSIYY